MGGMFFTSLQTCFFRQFGRSVDRSDYLTLRKGFIVVGDTICRMIISFFHSHFQLFMNDNNDTTTYSWYCFLFFFNEQNHHLTLKYDFHSYMIRSMEEEFQRIVGVR